MSFFTSPITTILVVIIVVSLVFIWRLLKKNPKSPIEVYFALAILSGVFWKIGVIGYRTAESAWFITFFTHISFFAPVLLILFEYLFVYYFPYRLFKLSKNRVVLLLCVIGSILAITIIPDTLIPYSIASTDRFTSIPKSIWQNIYGLFFGFMTFLIFRTLLVKYKHSDGIFRTRVRQVLIGNGMAMSGGFIFGFIIPQFYNRSLEWVGAVFSFCGVVYLWYHIFWIPNRKVKSKDFYGGGY